MAPGWRDHWLPSGLFGGRPNRAATAGTAADSWSPLRQRSCDARCVTRSDLARFPQAGNSPDRGVHSGRRAGAGAMGPRGAVRQSRSHQQNPHRREQFARHDTALSTGEFIQAAVLGMQRHVRVHPRTEPQPPLPQPRSSKSRSSAASSCRAIPNASMVGASSASNTASARGPLSSNCGVPWAWPHAASGRCSARVIHNPSYPPRSIRRIEGMFRYAHDRKLATPLRKRSTVRRP